MGGAASLLDCAVNPLSPLGDEDEDDAPMPTPFVLEDAVPLRASRVWALQADYYRRMGMRVWTEAQVPNFVSSNAFIARAYAKLLRGALWDAHDAAGGLQGEPVFIVEVGAGHGKLGYLIIESLLRLAAFLPPPGDGMPAFGSLPRLPFCYVITDPVPEVVDAIAQNPMLALWVQSGALDFAVLDAEASSDSPLFLKVRGVTLGGTALRGSNTSNGSQVLVPRHPVLAIANYVLDSLRTDAFLVSPGGGSLRQACVSLLSSKGGGEEGSGEVGFEALRHTRVKWSYAPVCVEGGDEKEAVAAGNEEAVAIASTADAVAAAVSVEVVAAAAGGAAAEHVLGPPYSTDPLLRSLLFAYQHSETALRDNGGVALIPLGGFALLRRLLVLSSGRMCVLVGDKGHASISDMASPPGWSAPEMGTKTTPPAPGAAAHAALRDPHLAIHGGVSLMVNFHALRAFTAAYGGFSQSTPYEEGFKIAALFFGGPRAGECALETPLPLPLPRTPNSSAAACAAAAEATRCTTACAAAARYAETGSAADSTVSFAGTTLPWYPVGAFGGAAIAAAAAAVQNAGPGGSTTLCPSVPSYAQDARGFCDDTELLEPLAGRNDLSDRPWLRTRRACSEILGGTWLTPDDFASLQRGLREESPSPSLRAALALLRLSNHDSDVFLKFRGVFLEKGVLAAVAQSDASHGINGGTPSNTAALLLVDPALRDLRSDVDRVFASYYPLVPSKDLCFELGRLLMGMRDYATAASLFAQSASFVGPHHVTALNRGVCHYYTGDLNAASAAFSESLSLNANYGDAASWATKLHVEAAGRAAAAAAAESAAAGRSMASSDASSNDGSGLAPPLLLDEATFAGLLDAEERDQDGASDVSGHSEGHVERVV